MLATHSRPLLSLAGALVLLTSVVACGASGVPEKPDPITSTWTPERGTQAARSYDWGASLRVRYVGLSNALDLGLGADPRPDREFFRFRTRLWYRQSLAPGIGFQVKLNNETFVHLSCETCDNEFSEIIFENLLLELDRPLGLPISARIGRQDLFYGAGFVIVDGTPLDGSRTGYVNGIILSASVPSWDADAVVGWDYKEDNLLPVINNKHVRLLEHDDFLAMLYLRRRTEDHPGFLQEHYYIFREVRPSGSPASIHTFGARLGFPLYWTDFEGEFAYQGGKIPPGDLSSDSDLAGPERVSAYGLRARIDAGFNWGPPWNLWGGYVQLSGNDPVTRNKHEGWDPVLGRWPKWSELLIYTLLLEEGVAYWQNLDGPFVGIGVAPTGGMKLELGHHWLGASQYLNQSPEYGTGAKPGGISSRGKLMIVRWTWNISGNYSGHILYEQFAPGSLYPVDAEVARFLRFEFTLSI
jgi:hypothetical protein